MSNPFSFLLDVAAIVAGEFLVLAIRKIYVERKKKRCPRDKEKHR